MSEKNYSKRSASEYGFLRALLQYFIIYFILYPYFKIFYKVKVIGRENIPKDESMIAAANHMSYLDPVIVSLATCRPVAYMAKKELFKNPVFAWGIAGLGAFAVNREKLEIATIKTAKEVLKTNWIMAMFPQGTRIEPGKIEQVNDGFAYLAYATKSKILPIGIVGSEKYQFIPFAGKLTIKIGKPIEYNKNLEITKDKWANSIAELTGFENNCVFEVEEKTKSVI